jgi:hypothetical protein
MGEYSTPAQDPYRGGRHNQRQVGQPDLFDTLVWADVPCLIIHRILVKTFEKAGHFTEWANNGKIGYEQVQETLFDLVIME